MPADQRLQRAAGVIMHKLRVGWTADAACAKASHHEPDLTEEQIAWCLDLAWRCLNARDILNLRCKKIVAYAKSQVTAGKPIDLSRLKGVTGEKLFEECGIPCDLWGIPEEEDG